MWIEERKETSELRGFKDWEVKCSLAVWACW